MEGDRSVSGARTSGAPPRCHPDVTGKEGPASSRPEEPGPAWGGTFPAGSTASTIWDLLSHRGRTSPEGTQEATTPADPAVLPLRRVLSDTSRPSELGISGGVVILTPFWDGHCTPMERARGTLERLTGPAHCCPRSSEGRRQVCLAQKRVEEGQGPGSRGKNGRPMWASTEGFCQQPGWPGPHCL